MKRLLLTVAFLLLLAPKAWSAGCTITGKVFNPDGSPLVNGTINFNSLVQQTLQGGVVVPITQLTGKTDATGTMSAMSIVQGLQGQFTFCSPQQGGCGNSTPVLIPIAATADISAILIGIQLSAGGNVVASSLNVSGDSTMGGKLAVTGQTTLGALTASGATILQSTLAVTGNAGFSNITASGTINATGALTAGASTLGAVTAPSLALTGSGANLTGTIQMNGPVGIGVAPVWSLDIANNQNATTEVHLLNNNAGTGAAATFEAANGTCVTDTGVFGSGATPSGSPYYVANRSYVLSSCAPGLLIQAAGTGAMLYLSAPNGHQVQVLGNQHFGVSNNGVSVPSPGTCGSSPSVVGTSTDNAGIINVNGVTSCQVVFAAGFPNTPACTCSSASIGTWCSANASTSGLTLTFGVSVTGSATWNCWGLF